MAGRKSKYDPLTPPKPENREKKIIKKKGHRFKGDRTGNYKAFNKTADSINRQRRLRFPESKKITSSECADIFNVYHGRCVFCGRPLLPKQTKLDSEDTLHMIFYIPLERGGQPTLENIVPVCPFHHRKRSRKQELREEIPDLNTFADHLHVLIESIVEFKERPTRPLVEKIKRIKRLINFDIDEIAINMRYKPFEDWLPERFEMLVEDHNTLPERIEKLTADTLDKEPEEVLQSDKDRITDVAKQMVVTGQYGFVRNPKESSESSK